MCPRVLRVSYALTACDCNLKGRAVQSRNVRFYGLPRGRRKRNALPSGDTSWSIRIAQRRCYCEIRRDDFRKTQPCVGAVGNRYLLSRGISSFSGARKLIPKSQLIQVHRGEGNCCIYLSKSNPRKTRYLRQRIFPGIKLSNYYATRAAIIMEILVASPEQALE